MLFLARRGIWRETLLLARCGGFGQVFAVLPALCGLARDKAEASERPEKAKQRAHTLGVPSERERTRGCTRRDITVLRQNEAQRRAYQRQRQKTQAKLRRAAAVQLSVQAQVPVLVPMTVHPPTYAATYPAAYPLPFTPPPTYTPTFPSCQSYQPFMAPTYQTYPYYMYPRY